MRVIGVAEFTSGITIYAGVYIAFCCVVVMGMFASEGV